VAITEDVDCWTNPDGSGCSIRFPGANRCLIACKVFADALAYLQLGRRYPELQIRYLPAHLHLNPQRLKGQLAEAVESARSSAETVCCLYGNCFPDIDRTLRTLSTFRPSCGHCYEALLGRRRYERVLDEQLGTFFLEKEMILNFDEHCWEPLELADPQMREWYFLHYRRVLYIRQPMDGSIEGAARTIASRLDLPLSVIDADYSDLNSHLIHALEP
jgi:hypothetical protein